MMSSHPTRTRRSTMDRHPTIGLCARGVGHDAQHSSRHRAAPQTRRSPLTPPARRLLSATSTQIDPALTQS